MEEAVTEGEVRDVTTTCGMQEDERVPLAKVVSDCTRRWFLDANNSWFLKMITSFRYQRLLMLPLGSVVASLASPEVVGLAGRWL